MKPIEEIFKVNRLNDSTTTVLNFVESRKLEKSTRFGEADFAQFADPTIPDREATPSTTP
jgi:hypothetical protein